MTGVSVSSIPPGVLPCSSMASSRSTGNAEIAHTGSRATLCSVLDRHRRVRRVRRALRRVVDRRIWLPGSLARRDGPVSPSSATLRASSAKIDVEGEQRPGVAGPKPGSVRCSFSRKAAGASACSYPTRVSHKPGCHSERRASFPRRICATPSHLFGRRPRLRSSVLVSRRHAPKPLRRRYLGSIARGLKRDRAFGEFSWAVSPRGVACLPSDA